MIAVDNNAIGRWRRTYVLDVVTDPVRGFSDAEFRVWGYTWFGPQSLSCGVFRFSAAIACEDMPGMRLGTFTKAFEHVRDACGWQYDPVARVLWLGRWFLERNPPGNPNVCCSWHKLLKNVPESPVKETALAEIRGFLQDFTKGKPEAFLKALDEGITVKPGKHDPNPVERRSENGKQKPEAGPQAPGHDETQKLLALHRAAGQRA